MIDVIHKSTVTAPKVSIVFLDWSCRESLHSLDYLAEQTVARDQYEIVLVEYYSRRTEEVSRRLERARTEGKPDPVDQWIIMGMPDDLYYHKHLMYNVGIAASRGEIVMIGDSDAMFRPSFVQSMLEAFDRNVDFVLHYDEVRNSSKKYYPFNYPSFHAVTGEGAINWKDGKTTGLLDVDDPIHTLNFGAAFCARRQDLIKIGGADEHADYVGHVCGPYEMTFRLVNLGRQMIWHSTEFLYHTWHPGQAGGANLLGPHDGAHVSTRALKTREAGRVFPWRENRAIQRLRQGGDISFESLAADLISPDYLTDLKLKNLQEDPRYGTWLTPTLLASMGNYNLFAVSDFYLAAPQALGRIDFTTREIQRNPYFIKGRSEDELRQQLSEIGANFDGHAKEVALIKDRRQELAYKLVAFGTGYYGIPQQFSDVDFFNDFDILCHWSVIFSRDRFEAEQQIHKLLASDRVEVLAGLEPGAKRLGQGLTAHEQKIEEHLALLKRPWWKRLTGMMHKKNRG
jgi:hypothetical protein